MFEKFRKRRGTKLTLKSEVDAMQSLQHGNIVELRDYFETPDSLYLVIVIIVNIIVIIVIIIMLIIISISIIMNLNKQTL